ALAAAGWGGGRVLLVFPFVRRTSSGLFPRRLTRGARARAAQSVTQDRHRRVRVLRVLLCGCVPVGVLLRLPDLDDVLLLPVPAAAREAVAVTGGLGCPRGLIRLALVSGGRLPPLPG